MMAEPAVFTIFKKERLRLDRELHNLDFLLQCKNLSVIPGFLKCKNQFIKELCYKTVHDFELKCLTLCIRNKYKLIFKLQNRTLNTHWDFVYGVEPEIFDKLRRKLEHFRVIQDRKKISVHNKKLSSLTRNQNYKPIPGPVAFINLSKKILTDEEVQVLNLGPKFMFSAPSNYKHIIPELESIIHKSPINTRELIRNVLFTETKKLNRPQKFKSKQALQTVKNLKADKETIIVQTDKSNKLAILDTTDYIKMMNETIEKMNCEIIKKDPNTKIFNKVNSLIKDGKWPDQMTGKIKMNKLCSTPLIFGRLKDHKETMTLRPIVAKCNSPTYYLEKAFVPILKDLLPESNRTVSSTSDFIQKLKTLVLPENYLLANLDVISLYPSIDTAEVCNIICEKMESSSSFNSEMKTTLKRGINLIIQNNYFRFKNVFFQQKFGAPMGSPISGLLAEFKMRPLEESIFHTFDNVPLYWYRYVDDIFIVWPHESKQLFDFADKLNTLDPNIKFTLEIENNNSLPFLDVLIHKHNGSLTRSVYRKPMADPNTIPFTACSPNNYKIAAYNFMVKRGFEICSDGFLGLELNEIRKIATLNGYSHKIINKIILKHTNNSSQNQPPIDEPLQRCTLQYHPGFFESIYHKLKKHKIQLIAKPPIKLKDLVSKNLEIYEKNQYSGVYEIPFQDKNGNRKYYIGMTSRKLKDRLKEHISDIKYGKETTALARQNLKENIIINFNESRILYKSKFYLPTIIRETIEILDRKNEICNEAPSFNLDRIWLSLLGK